MKSLWVLLSKPGVLGVVVSILGILHDALDEGSTEGEKLQALNDIAKVLVDVVLPGSDAKLDLN